MKYCAIGKTESLTGNSGKAGCYYEDRILACALAAGNDYLVTGGDDLPAVRSFHRARIVTPRAFELLF